MKSPKLEKWAQLLLDVGKRNALINFKDTKSSTLEIVSPSPAAVFKKAETSSILEVFDPKIPMSDEEVEVDENGLLALPLPVADKMTKEEYVHSFSSMIKGNKVLAFNEKGNNPLVVLKSLERKGRAIIEETGVNAMYLAFGFVEWRESDSSEFIYRSPILLIPVEFKNDSAISPHYILPAGDELVVNPTFNFKMQSDRGFCLPEYEDEGLDEYLKKVESITSKLGWRVLNETKLGSFSFLKINMYNDLIENEDKILANAIINGMLNNDMSDNQAGNNSLDDLLLDDEGNFAFDGNPLIELNNVVDADSSQIEAIEMAKSGKSFVLQGPPGTGKSQTITNIIAECLADEKTVLFVSEKQAALNVVYDKLKKAGLDEFCLELHSHKANKKTVIQELCHTLNMDKYSLSKKAEQELADKEKAQEELDAYAAALHKNNPVINKSLYQLFEAYSSCGNVPLIKVPISDINTLDENALRARTDLLEKYVQYVPSIGYDYRQNTWFGYNKKDNSFESKSALQEQCQKAYYEIKDLNRLSEDIDSIYGINVKSVSDIQLLGKSLRLICKSDAVVPAILNKTSYNETKKTLDDLKSIAEKMIRIENSLSNYDADFYSLDGADLHKKLTKLHSESLKRAFDSGYKEIVNSIRLGTVNGKKPSYQEAVDSTEKLSNWQALKEDYRSLENSGKLSIGKAYEGYKTDWEKLFSDLSNVQRVVDYNYSFGLIGQYSDSKWNEEKENISDFAEKILSQTDIVENAIAQVADCFDKSEFNYSTMPLSSLERKFESYVADFAQLDNWLSFKNLYEEITNAGLTEFLNGVIEYKIGEKDFANVYRKAFYRQWIDNILLNEPLLPRFDRIAHDRDVNIFTQKDKIQLDINKIRIKEKLSAKRPSHSLTAAGSACSILIREGEKVKKQMPIRTLLAKIGDLVLTLKPCFLMSPLSISTYLGGSDIQFDVVVFDEASQIFPQDAVGAIYRGKQLIVVGDKKQMPPTNFFNASVGNEDDIDEEVGDITDFDSILDMCSAFMINKQLTWHYRSRFEDLIAFSNRNYYDGRLVTFPSNITKQKDTGVDFYFANGVFDHKSHTNRIEAEYVADLVFKNAVEHPDRSLGVVAFNSNQQNLIEDIIFRRRIGHPETEEFFRTDKAEPFFVKNLESVQGDERDTIVFSATYAKDAAGKPQSNFGPLNRQGGERRLNVAVTRAKINVQLVSSMHCYDVNLTEKSSNGVKHLRDYLDYAENGYDALERAISVNSFDDFDSDFEMEVCEFLRSSGFSVDSQVGCSGYKIDLGLKRPDSSDYVLAIECDGAAYHSSKNARDRDRLRQEILENMGWKFYRIWSTDWFLNNRVEKERLIKACKDALNIADIPGVVESNDKPVDETDDSLIEYAEVTEQDEYDFPTYQYADINSLYYKYGRSFQQFIKAILEVEAPLSEEWLLKRISELCFRRSVVNHVVTGEYTYRMENCDRNGIVRRNGFLYLKDNYGFVLRKCINKNSRRDFKYVSCEELAAGIYRIVEDNVTVEKQGLYSAVAKVLGYSSVSAAMRERLDEAMRLIQNKLLISGDMISLK